MWWALCFMFYSHDLILFPQVWEVGTIIPVLQRGSERVSHLPKAPQLICSRTRISPQLCLLQNLFPNRLFHCRPDSLRFPKL